jgi:CheY-like chemotaxis protein
MQQTRPASLVTAPGTFMPERKNILIVESDQTIVDLLLGLIKNDEYSISVARDGLDALERLRRAKYDLLICDVWIPGISGLQLLAAIHDLPERVAVIIMTADDTPETVLQAVRAHALQFVNKPFKPQEMRTLVRTILSGPPAPPIEVVSAKPEWVELLVPCELRSVDRIQGLMMKLKAGLPAQVRESLIQAFRELLINAIEWGGELDATRKVRISYLRFNRMILYRISDPGKGFQFKTLAHAAAVAADGDFPFDHMKVREDKGMRPGGLGILMSKSMVDDLLYNEAQNEVVFVKYID